MKQMWILALFLGATLACQQAYDMGSANFYVAYNDSACDNFTFIKCQWQTCTRHSYYYVNRVMFSSCSRWETQSNTDWDFCTNKYCDENVDYPQNTQSIQQCKTYIDSKIPIFQIVLFSIAGAVVLTAFICCFWQKVCQEDFCRQGCGNCGQKICRCFESLGACVCYVFKCSCIRQASSRQIQPEPIHPPTKRNQLQLMPICTNNFSLDPNQHPQLKSQNQAESKAQGKKKHLPDLNSESKQTTQAEWKKAICGSDQERPCILCKGDLSTLQLNCGHRYHLQCACDKIMMAEKCPCCSSSDIQTVKLFCSQCFSQYLEIKISYLQVMISDKPICNQCQRLEADF